MKRVLFYYDNFSGEAAKGGTELATFRIAKALQDSGKAEVFHAFRSKSDGSTKSIYRDVVKLSHRGSLFEKRLKEFIIKNEIDVVVNMGRFFRQPRITKVVKSSKHNIKVIFMQHFAPGSEMKKSTFKSGLHLLKLNPLNPLYWLRVTFYPLLKLPRTLNWSKIYRRIYETSDHVVLLSDGYKDSYCKIGKFGNKEKFIAIPNIFENSTNELYQNNGENSLVQTKKQKRVLILSRMDEIQKRLSLALAIWKNIEDDAELREWHLDIVGDGHNTDIVKRMIKKLQLKNVTFHGWQTREHFLERSSILMMTSEYEGLPLTILEAQAYGCVPIAFNSFASINDVIENFNNGVIVDKFGDIEDYTVKLRDLMIDSDYRKELSANSKASLKKFSSEKVAEKWLRILTLL